MAGNVSDTLRKPFVPEALAAFAEPRPLNRPKKAPSTSSLCCDGREKWISLSAVQGASKGMNRRRVLPLAIVAFCAHSPLPAPVWPSLQLHSCSLDYHDHLFHRNRIDASIHGESKTSATNVRLVSIRPATMFHFAVMALSLNLHLCCCHWRCCGCFAIYRMTNAALPCLALTVNDCCAN